MLEVKDPAPVSEALKTQAQQRRPEFLKNRYQQNYNEAAGKVAEAVISPCLLPMRPMAGRVWTGLNQPSTWYVGAAMTFPLFEGLSTAYGAQSKAQLRATVANYEA